MVGCCGWLLIPTSFTGEEIEQPTIEKSKPPRMKAANFSVGISVHIFKNKRHRFKDVNAGQV